MKQPILYVTLTLTSLCAGWVFPRDLPDGVYHITLSDEHDAEATSIVKRGSTPEYVQKWWDTDLHADGGKPLELNDPFALPDELPPTLPVNDPPGDPGLTRLTPHVKEGAWRCIYNQPPYERPEYEIARSNLLNYCSRWGLPRRTAHISAARHGQVVVWVCNMEKKENTCSGLDYLWLEKHYLDQYCEPGTPGWVRVHQFNLAYGRGWIGDDICPIDYDTGKPHMIPIPRERPVKGIIWAGRPPEWGSGERPMNHKLVDERINWLSAANGRPTSKHDFMAEWDFPGPDGLPDTEKAIKENATTKYDRPRKKLQWADVIQAAKDQIQEKKIEELAAVHMIDGEMSYEKLEDILRDFAAGLDEEMSLARKIAVIQRQLELERKIRLEEHKKFAEEAKLAEKGLTPKDGRRLDGDRARLEEEERREFEEWRTKQDEKYEKDRIHEEEDRSRAEEVRRLGEEIEIAKEEMRKWEEKKKFDDKRRLKEEKRRAEYYEKKKKSEEMEREKIEEMEKKKNEEMKKKGEEIKKEEEKKKEEEEKEEEKRVTKRTMRTSRTSHG
ncbi:hypothetical protein EDB81DRAFT_758355 [Dactylonectria macrodidyma]|uniref:Uncharacterized protein n=1 Tax=Dactylonectria macrodidyma TaxID=307937 RepID=A0A9P9F6S6_9HYPO|nr:hypothetical protein EDB81DRAFT_758355 [Dactylonectria macrodidyma]